MGKIFLFQGILFWICMERNWNNESKNVFIQNSFFSLDWTLFEDYIFDIDDFTEISRMIDMIDLYDTIDLCIEPLDVPYIERKWISESNDTSFTLVTSRFSNIGGMHISESDEFLYNRLNRLFDTPFDLKQ